MSRRLETCHIRTTWKDIDLLELVNKLQDAGLYHVLSVLGAELELEGAEGDVVATFVGTSGALEIIAETLLVQGVHVRVVPGKPPSNRE